MNCLFIYNPNSGRGKIKKKIAYIEEQLKKKFTEVTIYATKSSEDTCEAAANACGKYDVLIFSGGDGTFNEVLCGVSVNEVRPILGYIPSGTVNDIARNLCISGNIKKALQIILEGDTMKHDVGLINGRHFMYVSAAGTFTGVSYRTKQHLKKRMGKVAYVLDGIKDLIKPQLLDVAIQTENNKVEVKVPLVLVLNSKSVGGIKFNKIGHLNDGYFDIVLVKNGINKGLMNIMKLFLFGIRKKSEQKHFIYLNSSDFTIDVSDDINWCVDGEMGPKGKVRIQNLHEHIEIFIPKR